jgi:hypothetical protein
MTRNGHKRVHGHDPPAEMEASSPYPELGEQRNRQDQWRVTTIMIIEQADVYMSQHPGLVMSMRERRSSR